MNIKFMRKVNSGSKVKAFFTLDTPKVDYNDFKLVEGKDGQLYAMSPSTEYEHKGVKKFKSFVYIKDEGLRDRITQLAREEYFRGQTPDSQAPDNDIPF